jgi:hypothetical protein
VDEGAVAPWTKYTGRAEPTPRSLWITSRGMDERAASPWGRYSGVAEPESRTRWLTSDALDQAAASPWGGNLQIAALERVARFATSVGVDRAQYIPWAKFARVLQPGWGVEIPEDDGVPEPQIVVPVRSVYVQVNTSSLRRVDGNVALHTFGLNLSLDMSSWVWSFSASIPADQLSAVESQDGEPVELEAQVNGALFRLLVERISRERQFAKATVSISGRGKAALLDAPYAPIQNFTNTGDRTIEQIMNEVLTVNGVPMPWTVDFGLSDWLVPTGVWSHAGSYMTALNRLAEAGGGYIQPHSLNQELKVLRKYPFMPHEWATLVDPDIELPSAPVTRESIEWVNKPLYNRVFVQGQQQGVRGRVTRAGTAGNLVAQTIVDPLITHHDAARQRGIPVLADVGRQALVGLRLPVLSETGVILPGKFVRYVDGGTTRIGLVRSTNLDVAMPQVWQTIKLETHHEPL